jgi:hypothetical protein
MDDWRKICEREGGPLCDEDIHCSTCGCHGLLRAERDRLARFALLLADDHGDCSFISTEEKAQSLADLWRLSADPRSRGRNCEE